ncbi:hypothetical protein GCM10018790_62610 [Kitasatospora xanthocidica]|nr:hypothetical protein GCM10018790_62610 [Kitasatospora xanthocidica]
MAGCPGIPVPGVGSEGKAGPPFGNGHDPFPGEGHGQGWTAGRGWPAAPRSAAGAGGDTSTHIAAPVTAAAANFRGFTEGAAVLRQVTAGERVRPGARDRPRATAGRWDGGDEGHGRRPGGPVRCAPVRRPRTRWC